MCNPKFKKETYKKRFFRPNNPLIRTASSIIKKLDGTNEEKWGQFEIISRSEEFQNRYPGLRGKDIRALVRLKLLGY